MGKEKLMYSAGENYIFTSILILSLLAYIYNEKFIVILIFYLILNIVNGNAKRIYSKNRIGLVRFLRRCAFLLPLYLPACFGISLGNDLKGLIFGSVAGAAFSILLILIKIRDWRLGLSSEIIGMYPKEDYNQYVTRILYILFAAVGEELFFRNFILGYIKYVNAAIIIFISILLFTGHHLGTKWNENFSKYDFFIQAVFSMGSSILFILSGSVVPCIIAHVVYNFPHMLREAKCLICVFKLNKFK